MNGTKIRTKILTLAMLATAVGFAAAAAAADDLPVQEPRIWAPTGDRVGLQNHATGTFQTLDPHGSEAKAAEDWQLLGKYSGSLLFGWHRTSDGGYRTDIGAYGTNEQGGLTGRLGASGAKPGHARWALTFRNADQYYDRTSEMRRPGFKYPPAPPALGALPHLEWRMLDIDLGYRLGSVGLRLDFDRMCRNGVKGSLLRSVPQTGADGTEVPGTKVFDTTRNEIRLGADYAGGAFAADLGVAFRAADGDRALDERQARTDDQQVWRVQLNADYDLGARTRLLGGVSAANLTDDGSESRATATVANSETKTVAGRLGLATRLGRATTVSVSGFLQDLDTDARLEGSTSTPLQAVDRQRSRQELRAMLANTSLTRTRLQLRYRYRQADLDESTSEGDLPGGAAATRTQTVTQDATSHDLAFRARHRFSRSVQLRIRAGWRLLEVDETTAGDVWFWTMGDRKRERLSGEAALQTRLGRDLKLDLGWRGWDQTFTRSDDDGTETGWQANTVFAGLNWNAHARILLHGTVSWGVEKVALTGVGDPTGSMGPVAYDGTTLRFIPAVSLQVLDALWLDGMYEGVRYEDTANESASLDALAADHDRMLARARWELREDLTVAATYRRNEFDENRWDDYIQDLWQLSLSGRF